MSDTMKLTLQLTAIDMLSGVVSSARQHIQSLGIAGKKVQKDFDDMTNHITKGLKAIAVTNFGFEKMKTGVDYAASLEEAMGNVHMDLMRTGQSAADLNAQLSQVRSTAVSIQAFTPFSAEDVVKVEDTLLKAGLKLKDVVGEGGAAWAASAIATITGKDPVMMAQNLVHAAIPFKISGADYGKLADDLQRVSVASGADIDILGGQLKEVAGQAASMHISLKEMLTTLGVLMKHGMGEESGHSLSMFLTMLNGITPRSIQYMKQLGINAYDMHGHIKPTIDIINQLRGAFSKLTDQQRQQAAVEIFSRRGMRVALDVLEPGEGSYEDITARIAEQASLPKKIAVKSNEYITQMHALQTTWQTTQATFFTPFLTPLKEALGLLNDMAAKVGEIGEKHKGLTSLFAGSLGAGVIAGGSYGLYELLRGAGAGSRVLKGIGGIKGLLKGVVGSGAGIAEGKVVQAATGVIPVFVTNWPGSPILSQTKDIALETAAIGEIKSIGTKAAAAIGAESLASVAMLAGAATGIGVLLGNGINYLLGKGGPLDSLSNYINKTFDLNPHFKGSKGYEEYEANKKKEAERKAKPGSPPVEEEKGLRRVVHDLAALVNRNALREALPSAAVNKDREQRNKAMDTVMNRELATSVVKNHALSTKIMEVKNAITLNMTIDDRGRVITKTNDPNTQVTINALNRGVHTND